ncbi:YdcF family protein [Actinomadura terrae]|uniref:YdcF family protein n=1 Tax=Actinomadura terrae TaxID=604353 RepID=UPI001FA72014|nr:YdcF family protein [Actinomadura terrae]
MPDIPNDLAVRWEAADAEVRRAMMHRRRPGFDDDLGELARAVSAAHHKIAAVYADMAALKDLPGPLAAAAEAAYRHHTRAAADEDEHRPAILSPAIRDDVATLWAYHQMGHQVRPVDVGIGLGSHDLSVATYAADLWRRATFPLIVFTGANAPTTRGRFPRGEAVHYREHALSLGVPAEAILVEPAATNTAENLTLTRKLLSEHNVTPRTVMLISRPYQQRRAYATCRKIWPEVEVICGSIPMTLDHYVAALGDVDRVVNMLVGDTQRIELYADRGFAIPQPMPDNVRNAYQRLVDRGFTTRLVA